MIIDANVAVYWAVPGPHAERAASIMGRENLAAPGIIMAEAANALVNHVRAGSISHTQIGPMISTIRQAIDTLVFDADLVPDALALAIAHNHKMYDCLYLALALARREPLATADRRLAALASKLSIETELIEPAL
ncbi:MAG: type II toxin-antitoxin system VapC family toxin [Aquamicrobium sp.]|uniref:type II toxin-antitoxin system VapC family toxin n=1 Tax=Aquamicrobium sp. TaxID=1872579 RepID=UPI00349E5847|nr:type II toxin-antitoxin system VapC family toxin [Aquamicrobium sp.]